MELIDSGNYNLQGVVLIDEIETHLHVDLQKKILPFLSDFFPNIQFIITTHSPFVLQSISNSVVCDLQKLMVVENLSGYSYDTLVESYFGADKYSEIIKEKIERFERLSEINLVDEEDKEEYFFLTRYFENIPKHFAPELDVKLQQIKLNQLANKKV
jgi:predicted ATP-binding protein involved in virulence